MIATDINKIGYKLYYKDRVKYGSLEEFYGEYLNHILKHKAMVFTAWMYLADKLCELGFINESDMDKIHINIINHDNSKFLSDEFYIYAKRFYRNRRKNLRTNENFKKAVKLHKERNLHHFESLKDYKGDDWKCYAVELVCDYIAMGWEFNNYVCEYFGKVKDELKDNLPNEYYSYIESIIKIIPNEFSLAEEPLTTENMDYISHFFDNHNDPFEDNDYERNRDNK